MNWQLLMARLALQDNLQNLADYAEAFTLAEGRVDDLSGLLPPVLQGDRDGREEAERVASQVKPIGDVIVQTKLDCVVGEVNWGKAEGRTDAALNALDLKGYARKLAQQLIVGGMCAGWAYVEEATRRPVLGRLGQYIQPVTDLYDVDRILGIRQVMKSADARVTGYRVRIFDLESSPVVMREWERLPDPNRLGERNFTETANVNIPHYAIAFLNQEGRASGEILRAMPLLRQEVALQALIIRVARRHGYPLTVVSGQPDMGRSSVGLGGVVFFAQQGAVSRVEAGDLSQLFDQHDRLLQRIQRECNMFGGFLGAGVPSGEALREVNTRFYNSCQGYASQLSRVMSKTVGDYLELLGLTALKGEIKVSLNRDYLRELIITGVTALVQAGLMPVSVGMRAIQPYFSDVWSDEELEAEIKRRSEVVDVNSFRPPAPNPNPQGGSA